MNFFQHQDDARKRTFQLVLLFGFAILSLIAITSIFIATFLYYFQSHATSMHALASQNMSWSTHLLSLLQSKEILWISLGVILVVCAGALIKHLELKRGGSYVAESLGGRLIVEASNPQEKKLINVVEEMAIASGSPVPSIYLLDEKGINAFAAGNTCSNAVIGITKGALEQLNREQLQGVIAHEFSHIQHGDMRLNMRLLAFLNGIVLLGLIGEMLARSSSRTRYRNRGKNRNQLALLGIGLIVIGFCGTFFGNLIKAAVSRQREFLADASAVQYTRNPEGIAGALNEIKTSVSHSFLHASSASEFGHFYFATGARAFFSKMFATHPPLDIRISRILKLSPKEILDRPDKPNLNKEPSIITASEASQSSSVQHALTTALGAAAFSASTASKSKSILNETKTHLHGKARDPYTARSIVFSLLLNKNLSDQNKQRAYLEKNLHPSSLNEFNELSSSVLKLSNASRFALLQICTPALRSLSTKQREWFIDHAKTLIGMDNKVSVEEWAFLALLNDSFDEKPHAENETLTGSKTHINLVLRFMSELNKTELRESAFFAAKAELKLQMGNRHNQKQDYPALPSLSQVNSSLNHLKKLRPLEKPRLIKALSQCSNFDGHLSINEQTVLKAISAILNCPISLS